MTYSTEDIVDFVMLHRKNKVFRGMDERQIAQTLATAGEVLVSTDDAGRITGVIVAAPEHERQRLHIKHVLTIAPEAIRKMLKAFHAMYDGWTITGKRRGRFVVYNTPRLVHLLEVT